MAEPTVFIRCPPPCSNGEYCREEATCTPDTCPHGQKGWRHTADCIKHTCAHDFNSGPVIEFDDGAGMSTTCACGMSAFSHAMRYAP